MATDSLAYVLGLLRRIKSTPNVNMQNATLGYVHEWAGSHSSLHVAKLVIAIQENLESAQVVIEGSGLSDEAKSGLFGTISALKSAFAFENLNSAPVNYLPAIDPAITNFAIVTSSVGAVIPDEALDALGLLVSDLHEFLGRIDSFELPLNVKLTVKRHVSLLIAMLNNAQAVGIEPAISAYYDLVLALRKEKSPDAEDKQSSGGSFWSQIKEWSGRIESLANLVEQGSKALPYLDALPKIAGF
jgi:hypothetical protein